VSIFSSPGVPFRTRVSLLEERLSSYDEISKQMLSKLEEAVKEISESNRNISQILIRHEERIDRASENNAAIVQLMSKTEAELKEKIEKSIGGIEDQVKTNSTSIEELKRGKWIWVGVVAASSFFLGQSKLLERIHIPPVPNNNVEYTSPNKN